ncbi:hypothetical protein QBC44DRAFT_229024 [Cladorrhinum sp. PSN332]|nr:hypothetical protein QBC44DRAFT_229024 [Cladorrhinum sp. PSN332]
MFLHRYISSIQRALYPSEGPEPGTGSPEKPPPQKSYTPLPPPNSSYLVHCANLHNKLLSYSNPNTPHHLNTLSFLPSTIPPHLTLYDLQSSPISHLLPLLKTTNSHNSSAQTHPTPLSYFLHQPDLHLFFPSLFRYDLEDSPSPFICLYADRYSSDAPEEGGLFVDVNTLKATWNQGPGSASMDSLKWYPLDQVLQREVDRWEAGKYVYDEEAEDNMRIAKIWMESDVDEAVEAWEALLDVLCVQEKDRDLPISQKNILDGLVMNDFAKAFLARARRPKGTTKWVAPGVGVFDEESIKEAYASEESENSMRVMRESYDTDGMKLIPRDVDDIPSLVFPGTEKARVFVRWGSEQRPYYGLLNGMAGLYANGDHLDGDVVVFISPAGSQDSCQFAGVCPWNPGRYSRLSEVLRWWANLVEEGIWKVGEEGVTESADWFDVHREMYDDSEKLDWNDFNVYEHAEKSPVHTDHDC